MNSLLDLLESLPIDVCIEDILEWRYNLQLVVDGDCLSWDFVTPGGSSECDLCVIEALIHNQHTNIIAEYDEDQNIIILTATWGGGGWWSVALWQSIFVSEQTGNNSTALRERMDLPYKTIEAAIGVYQPGDTIFVYPGTYILNWPLDIPDADNFHIHFYNWAHVYSLPEWDIFQVGAWFILTWEWTFHSLGSWVWNHAIFRLNAISSWDVYIEWLYFESTRNWIVLENSIQNLDVIFKSKQWLLAWDIWIDFNWNHTIEISSDITAWLWIRHRSWSKMRLRKWRIQSTIAGNPAYTQLSLSQFEIYEWIFIAEASATYALDTNVWSAIKIYWTAVANKAVNPAIVQQVWTVVVDALVS